MSIYRLLAFGMLFVLWSCNDGDVTIDNIKFEGQETSSCDGTVETDFLYKTQGNQALMLFFDKGTLKNEVSTIEGEIPTKFRLVYRSLTDSPSSSYFCSTPPPVSPVVEQEINAKGGKVLIETKEVDEGEGKMRYDHLIKITDLVMTNSAGEKLINSSFIFGIYSTRKE